MRVNTVSLWQCGRNVRSRGGGWEKQRRRAVVSLEMGKQVVVSLEISSPGGAIVVYVLTAMALGPFGRVWWLQGVDVPASAERVSQE